MSNASIFRFKSTQQNQHTISPEFMQLNRPGCCVNEQKLWRLVSPPNQQVGQPDPPRYDPTRNGARATPPCSLCDWGPSSLP